MKKQQKLWTTVLVINALLWVAFLQLSAADQPAKPMIQPQGPAVATTGQPSLSAEAPVRSSAD